jgi:glycosyltransferase involved in cell wall biosynthesis
MVKLGILYYVESFPKLSESFILNEINEFYARGHDVAVFAQKHPNESFTHDEYEKIEVPIIHANASYTDFPGLVSEKSAQMALTHAKDGFFKHFSAKRVGHNLLLGTRCARFVEALDFEVDVIHAHFANPTSIGAMFAARYHGIPCTVTAHAVEIFSSPNVPQIKYICDGMDHVVVPSEYNRDYLNNEIGVANDITVVPATIRVEKFEPSGLTVENRLLTVARLVEKKGYPYAIKAVSKLIEQGYDVEYHIIGSGVMENRLKQRVKECGLDDHVEFLGHVSDERLQRELSEAAVFVLPCVIAEDGDRDAMPVVLKEAMASETACVSTTVSAIPELITDGHDGLLVPEKEPDKLVFAIQELLDNPEKREAIATSGRQKVQNKFDISQSIDTMTSVFKSLLS